MFSSKLILLISLALAAHVSARGVSTAANRASDGNYGTVFAVADSTTRDSTKPKRLQRDANIVCDEEVVSGEAGPCGGTLAGGMTDVATSTTDNESTSIPHLSADGLIEIAARKFNLNGNTDGAGPYTPPRSFELPTRQLNGNTDGAGPYTPPRSIETTVRQVIGNTDGAGPYTPPRPVARI